MGGESRSAYPPRHPLLSELHSVQVQAGAPSHQAARWATAAFYRPSTCFFFFFLVSFPAGWGGGDLSDVRRETVRKLRQLPLQQKGPLGRHQLRVQGCECTSRRDGVSTEVDTLSRNTEHRPSPLEPVNSSPHSGKAQVLQ